MNGVGVILHHPMLKNISKKFISKNRPRVYIDFNPAIIL